MRDDTGCPQYDFVITNLLQGCTFIPLVLVFICWVDEQHYRLALIQLLEKSPRSNVKWINRDLSIFQWWI
jgi:hypothetical protein